MLGRQFNTLSPQHDTAALPLHEGGKKLVLSRSQSAKNENWYLFYVGSKNGRNRIF